MKKETKKIIRILGMILFLIYIIMLVYFLFFAEGYGRVPESEQGYRYNLVPFVEVRRFWKYREQLGSIAVFTNIFGNIIGFLPFGFILPVITNRTRSMWVIVAAGFALSLSVETVQLITRVGAFDVDDLILNTLGALIGYLLFLI
ncbi:MAG: VanZ family protein, partial [Lachnospiraceae bacterium]|nr:VanZ family protein [Lachnospiraceae bacterium]